MRAKIVVSELTEPLSKELMARSLRNAHDRHRKHRNDPKHQAITICEVRDYTEVGQDWAVIFLEGGEKTIMDFIRELTFALKVDIEVVWNW